MIIVIKPKLLFSVSKIILCCYEINKIVVFKLKTDLVDLLKNNNRVLLEPGLLRHFLR